MNTITFTKTFLTGTLVGLSIPSAIRYPASMVDEVLAAMTDANATFSDVMTGARFVYEDVEVEEVTS